MRRLGFVDMGFLAAESRYTPMHVGGLSLFSLPEDAGADYVGELFRDWIADDRAGRPFNQRLTARVGVPHWSDDPDFDIEYHLRHSALPRPGRFRELFALVSRLHGTLIDRSRPLWEYHLIEGLEGNRFAMYAKMHHAVIDGVGAMRLLERSLSDDPAERGRPHPWIAAAARGERRPAESTGGSVAAARGAVAAVLEQLQGQLGAIPGVARTMRRLALSALEPAEGRMALPFAAPRSPLNSMISGARRFVAQSYSLERFRAVGRATDATINDIILAVSAAALRTYLERHGGGVPDRPLTAMAPISVRPAESGDGDDFGNAITAVLVNLGTHLADPLARLETIKASMADGKAAVKELTFTEVMLYTMLASSALLAPSLLRVSPRLPPFNIVISNVPGPRQPLFWNGARLEGMYPASIVMHGLAVNITVTSYAGSLDFGVTACRRSVPAVQRFIDYLAAGLAELEAATL